MNLLEAFMNSPSRKNRGQRIGEAIGEYIPPNLRPLAEFIAGNSPTAVNQRAGAAFSRAAAPDRTISQRIGDVGEGLSETASIAAPMAVTAKLGKPAVDALQEGLLGTTIATKEAGRTIAERANQRGPVPTMYSNPVMRAAGPMDLTGATSFDAPHPHAGRSRAAAQFPPFSMPTSPPAPADASAGCRVFEAPPVP